MAPNRHVGGSAVGEAADPPPFYGEPHKYDPSFRGPVHRRRCTDVFCCLIFILAVLSYVALGFVAWLHGAPGKVLHPTDSYGQLCGQSGTPNAQRPLLFYFNILKCANPSILINLQCPTTQMCVSKCPDKFATYSEMQLERQIGNGGNGGNGGGGGGVSWQYYRHFCKPGFNDPHKPVSQVLRDEDCPSMIVPSRPIFQRCLPDVLRLNGTANQSGFQDAVKKTRNVTELLDAARVIRQLVDTRELALKILEDYAKSWPWIILALLIATMFSLIFVVLLRFTATLMLWISIMAVLMLLTYGLWYCCMALSTLEAQRGSDVSMAQVGLQTDLKVYLQLRQTWMIFLASLAAAALFLLLILAIMRRRISLAIALLKEASEATSHMLSTLLYPLVTFFLLAVCICYWAVTAVHLASSGEAVYKVASPNASCRHADDPCRPETFDGGDWSTETSCEGSRCLFAFYGGESTYHRYLAVLQISNLLLFLWLANFSLALGQCTLAGAFSSYYWASRKPQDVPAHPLGASFARALRYHTGSLAFGALVLSAVQLFRIILKYLDNKLKGLDNSLSRFLLCCLSGCFWCLEKIIRYMNSNAYIMVAIYGKSFFRSAQDAFFLLMRNMVRVAVVDRVTDFLLFLGKIMVAGGVGMLASLFFTGKFAFLKEEVPQLNYYEVPVLTAVVGSYLIAHAFFSVYAMCVDTFFLCFCDDLERNDGSSEKPFFMSPTLRRILGKSQSC
ncbi:choline transporter-like protein 5-A [Stigmatopora nigra]